MFRGQLLIFAINNYTVQRPLTNFLKFFKIITATKLLFTIKSLL